MVQGFKNLPHEVLLILGVESIQTLLGADVPPVAHEAALRVVEREDDLRTLLLAEALVELCGQGVLACRCGTQGGKGRERRRGTPGTQDLAAADGLPVKVGAERIHDLIFSEMAVKDQQELTEGLKPLGGGDSSTRPASSAATRASDFMRTPCPPRGLKIKHLAISPFGASMTPLKF